MKRVAQSRELYPYVRLMNPAKLREATDPFMDRLIEVPFLLVMFEWMLRRYLKWYMKYMDEVYDYYICEGP